MCKSHILLILTIVSFSVHNKFLSHLILSIELYIFKFIYPNKKQPHVYVK